METIPKILYQMIRLSALLVKWLDIEFLSRCYNTLLVPRTYTITNIK